MNAGFLNLLHGVPEGRAVLKLRRGVDWQHNLRVDNAGFMRVVVGHTVPLVGQPFAAPVGGGSDSRTAHAPLDDLNGTVKNCYAVFLLPPQSLAREYRPVETEQTQSGCFVSAGAHGVWGRYFPIASARTQQPPAGRTTPERCISAPFSERTIPRPRRSVFFPQVPPLPADGKGQSGTP